MSRRVSPLAGFQVTIIGRFWVTTEAEQDSKTECLPMSQIKPQGYCDGYNDCCD